MFDRTNEIFILAQKNRNLEVLKFKLDQQTQIDILNIFNSVNETFNKRVEEVPFQIFYTLEDDEIFAIDQFNLPDEIKNAIDNPDLLDYYSPSNSMGLTQTGKEVKAIFTGKKDGTNYIVAFQKFEKRQVVKRSNNILFLDNETFCTMNKFTISLGTSVSCYFDSKLKFLEYRDANRVFDLSDYYREATSGELTQFKNSPQFDIADSTIFDSVTNASSIRKKIAKIIDSKVLTRYSASQLKSKATELGVEILLSDEEQKIILPSDRKLIKKILAFLCEQVFKGNLTGQTYYTNSTKIQE